MDKKAVVHIHKGVLLSHLKEYIWISSNEVDETGAYYTERSKPERKTPIVWKYKKPWIVKAILMGFRKMVTITLYARQQNRHRCIEQSFGLCGREQVLDDLGEWHWNMYNTIYEMSHQSGFDVGYWMLGAGALGWPRGMVWGARWEGGSGWGTCVHPWWIHVNVWQNQYSIVK